LELLCPFLGHWVITLTVRSFQLAASNRYVKTTDFPIFLMDLFISGIKSMLCKEKGNATTSTKVRWILS
jgi:hypothetical protein